MPLERVDSTAARIAAEDLATRSDVGQILTSEGTSASTRRVADLGLRAACFTAFAAVAVALVNRVRVDFAASWGDLLAAYFNEAASR